MEARVLLSGSISGTVFADSNRNGVQDSGESGVAGVRVYMDPNYNHKIDAGEQSVLTDANGNYTFANPPADPEIIRIVLTNGLQQTFPANGAGDYVGKFTGTSQTANFGVYAPVEEIAGRVFNDVTGLGVAGVTVYLDPNYNHKIDPGEPSTVTDGYGDYIFDTTVPDPEIVRIVVPSGATQTSPANGAGLYVGKNQSEILDSEDFSVHFPVVNLPGGPDTSFGVGGVVTPGFSAPHISTTAATILVQSDGKSIFVGTSGPSQEEPPPPGTNDFALARYSASGALDTTYGTGGSVFTSFPQGNVTANAAVLQSDGKVIVVGTDSNNQVILLTRYTTSGALDTTFGTKGIVVESPGFMYSSASAVAVDASGRIIVTATTFDSNLIPQVTLFRFLANGTLDKTFGAAGIVRVTSGPLANTDASSAPTAVNSVAIDASGNIDIAGGTGAGAFFAARLTSTGAFDATFGTGGVTLISYSSAHGTAAALAIVAGGKILLGGTETNVNTFSSSFALARLNSNGTLDTSFGTAGKTVTAIANNSASATSMAIQSNGKIILVGSEAINGINGYSFGIVRYSANGFLDTTFNGTGELAYNTTESEISGVGGGANSVAVQPDGKIIVAGTQTNGGPGGSSESAIINRFLADTATTASISGTVFNDLNHNGIQDPGELGLAGVVVYGDPNYNHKIDGGELHVVTDANGRYVFSNVTTDMQILRILLPAGDVQTFPVAGSGQQLAEFNYQVGDTLANVIFGIFIPTAGHNSAITGSVFADINGNHVEDPNDSAFGNTPVYLDLNHDGKFDAGDTSVVTDAVGDFIFLGLAPGTYTVDVAVDGGKQTYPLSGGTTVTVAAGQTVSAGKFGIDPNL